MSKISLVGLSALSLRVMTADRTAAAVYFLTANSFFLLFFAAFAQKLKKLWFNPSQIKQFLFTFEKKTNTFCPKTEMISVSRLKPEKNPFLFHNSCDFKFLKTTSSMLFAFKERCFQVVSTRMCENA